MTYRATLHYLLEQLPMFQRNGAAAYRNDLTNITALCHLLHHPQRELKCIHIAGTNGKGSVAHILSSILQEQGFRVGMFVSPHYKDYRERIKVNGKYISKQFVTEFVTKNHLRFKKINASFFEITTVMAFDYFKHKKVDFAVIETGMGGRLDSTNIITPILSIITNIGLDHQQFLGNTLAEIAMEKAGIMKSHIPVVVGEITNATKAVFVKQAKKMNAPIYFADKKYVAANYKTDIKGNYQSKNITTALTAIEVLNEKNIIISKKAIQHGLKRVITNTTFIGRWMEIRKKPLVILDSAHNQDGIKELMQGISAIEFTHLHIVYGTVSDKDIRPVLALLPNKATYYFCKADIPRGLEADKLKEQAQQWKLNGEAYRSVKTAFSTALRKAQKKDLVLVTGSVFVVAEVV